MRPADLPVTPAARSGTLRARAKMAAWRTRRPVTDPNKCDLCMVCVTFCPEGARRVVGSMTDADLDICKGCGICAVECPRGAIEMVPELEVAGR
ncbi:4Fe-4S binding protein [Caldinitratiruptor microaerophilus]|uniref:Pyruvate ferredoxin/flavodoxin oxidoreductase subunit delta n=1 Tax=Caldinitratiruptor microaerophilus TaxID=671077 RepID=A0AA35CJ49_9FIRM|nr:4Fe-4S binding protein [Caldinitratiruptor microaerophilus]BDG60152.1 pyruvate ferredoxin/flavodoxin oxidoreductase subunit delta [Caldinitratiruptor microaerophilus]